MAAFFGADKDKAQKELRNQYHSDVEAWRPNAVNRRVLEGIVEELRSSEKPVPPFHWEIEFPEVFERENPGFDAIVGNPPFAGKNTVSDSNVAGFPDWLKQMHAESHGNADLVAHFFRRAFTLVREAGTFGLIATNTIAQGDTRSTGLRWICQRGGEIFAARRRVQWPGRATVVVSVVHLIKGKFVGQKLLDDRVAEKITAFLFHRGSHDDPTRLHANEGMSFKGSNALGIGFTFEDGNPGATPIEVAFLLIERDPRNKQVLRKYVNGREINAFPKPKNARFIIDFGTMNETEASTYPELFAIARAKVKGTRAAYVTQPWWQFERSRAELYRTIRRLDRCLVISQISKHLAFEFYPTDFTFSHNCIVFAASRFASFCAMQSQVHVVWARYLGSSFEDRPIYTPTGLFRHLPLPRRLGDPPGPRNRRPSLLRVPRCAHGPKQRRTHQDVQSVPRPE